MIYLIFSSRFELLASITRRSQGILEIQNPSFLNLRVFAGFLRIFAGFLRVKLVVFFWFFHLQRSHVHLIGLVSSESVPWHHLR